jgi:hypothetical protein
LIQWIDKILSGKNALWAKALFRWFCYTALGGLLLAVDPFGLGSFAEEGSQKALYEIGGPLYSSDAREDITIVLVTESSLKRLYELKITGTNEWPLLYQDWGVILKTIAAHDPRSIFVDVLFEQERVTDPSLPSLKATLDRLRYGPPIYFAAGAPPYDSPLLTQLDAFADLVGSSWEGHGNGVPLEQHGYPLAATALYQDVCNPNTPRLAGCNTNSEWALEPSLNRSTLSLVWGSRGKLPLTAELEGYSRDEYCTNNTDSLGDLGVGVLKGAIGEWWEPLKTGVQDLRSALWGQTKTRSQGTRCLFHRVIDVEELLLIFDHGTQAEKAALMRSLENKVVLLGTFFEGLPDTTETPNLGTVPGVALHAMMLDNLMKYGPDYIKTAGLNTLPYNASIWAFMVLFLVLWIAWREQNLASRKTDAFAPFTGWDATAFLVVSFSLTCAAAFLTYYLFRFEPANAIGFMGLAELTRRIYGKPKSSKEEKA